MSEAQNLDNIDPDFDEEDNSPIIKELRFQLRAKEKQLAELQTFREKVEADAQSRRESAAEQVVNTLGIPGLKDDVLNWVEGDITEEAVKSILEAKSIPLPSQDGAQPTPNKTGSNAPVSEIAQQVADAAAGRDMRSLDERIANASSQAELNQLMKEAGLTQQHA